ncbi:DUF2577 domain-containing protein [Solibacillus cecembensis]|uniref:DUF2577 domain-containing protein n=1 Tax=Solibacillus cecembensis TaxID=459347 RepID=UPI003CFDBB59
MTDIMIAIRKVVLGAVNAQKLTNIVYGTVISTSPLKIYVDQKLSLEAEHLKLTRAVMDHEVDMTVDNVRRKYLIHNGLGDGDKVTMIRVHGGQQYLIIDKEVV